MITQPTVFVLGAGASHPYEFPLGQTLLTKVADGLSHVNSEFEKEICAATGAVDDVRAFGRDLRRSGRVSIDAFLDTRREFLQIGKVAIARVLTDYEVDNHLTTSRPNEGWYHYLFDRMFTQSPNDFRKNRLSVVTFNFDRSFERALILALMANYGIDEERATELAKCVPVLHIHGQLGPLWPNNEQQPNARPYRPLDSNPIVRAKELRYCASQIRIIHEEVEGPTLDAALEMMRSATVVCFLGFGYHEANLKRLQTHNLGGSKQTVMGTNFGMYSGEWQKAKKAFVPPFFVYSRSVLGFLQETNVIHE